MKRLTVFIVILVFCVLLAIWAPWTNLSISSIFGIKQSQDVAGLQVYSLAGKLDILLDGEKIGTVLEGTDAFIKDNVNPGDHLVTLTRESDVANAYWSFSKVVTFLKGTTVVASYNLGPTDEFSEGHTIYSTTNVDPENKLNLSILSNVDEASLQIDNNTNESFEGKILNTTLDLGSQHNLTIHKDGYDDLVFTILPTSQSDRDKLKGLILNIDAHLMLQPLQIETK